MSSRCRRYTFPSLRFLLAWPLGVAAFVLLGGTLARAQGQAIAFVQSNYATPSTATTTVKLPYTSTQAAGDLNVVVVGWADSTAQIGSVSDSKGNVYGFAAGPTVQAGSGTQAILYAKNIVAAAAQANVVTVTFTAAARYPDIRIAEYRGIDAANPLDTSAAAQGNSALSNSGSVATTNANDLLVGANDVRTVTTGPGSGYTRRVITIPDGDILEDRVVTATGSYSATAPVSPSGGWIMQMVAFRAAAGGTIPNITGLNPTSGAVGTPVTIAGTNFGATQGTSTVKFNGVTATPTSWSATSIAAPVPAGATTGNVLVTVSGTASNGVSFTVLSTPPSITSLNPTSGAVGTSVTIAGTNFGATQGSSTIKFNGVTATPTSWSATSIAAPVPTGATTGNVVVAVSGVASNGLNFAVQSSVATIAFVQSNSAVPPNPQSTVTVPFTAAQGAGDLNVVAIGWFDTTTTITSVTDTKGNTYIPAVGPTAMSGTGSHAIYYAKNIPAAAANANSVSVKFSAAAPYPDVRILEYSGLDIANPFDVSAAATGNGATSNSGLATTTNANDLLLGANNVTTATATEGSGFTKRIITNPNGSIAEDRIVTATGSYSASASLSSGGWIMQMVAFRAAGSGGGAPPPPISVSLSGAPASLQVSASGSITATVLNDSQSKGVTWSATCGSASCGSFSPTSTPSGVATSYTAPASVPAGNTVTVTATSVADTTKSASATATITSSGSAITVTVKPRRTSVTLMQAQQFTATVQNAGNTNVSWFVDGVLSGNPTVGTITPSGLYTPPAAAAMHTVTATSAADTTASGTASVAVTDFAGLLTYHYDNARTGQNLRELALSPATVNTSSFGKLFSCPVDGYVYAQPLYLPGLSIGGVTHNIVFVATEHDSVYAFDADASPCQQLWHTSFLGSGVTSVPSSDVGESNLTPEIGITGTPVIDPNAATMYLVAKTKESGSTYVNRLHALDIVSGLDKAGSPVGISGSVAGSGDGSDGRGNLAFANKQHMQRPALLLQNGIVYVAFGSHSDVNPYHGWVMAYTASSLQQVGIYNTSPNGRQGAIWQSGNGPAADPSGNLYLETANGNFTATSGSMCGDCGDSFVKLGTSSGLTLVDYFSPADQAALDTQDIDLGSGGPMVLPDSLGSTAHPHLLLGGGKTGSLYLLDRDNLGRFHASGDTIVEKINVAAGGDLDGFFSKAALWQNNIYVLGVGDFLKAFQMNNGLLTTTPTSQSPASDGQYSYPAATPTVSASGSTNGIVWTLSAAAASSNGPAYLRAYDATNLGTKLYDSTQAANNRDQAGAAVKYAVPTVANGKVYIGGETQLTVYGLLP